MRLWMSWPFDLRQMAHGKSSCAHRWSSKETWVGIVGSQLSDPKVWALAELLVTCNTDVIEESLTRAANAHIF